ncbi:MAG TPA: NAD(P)-dependent oxidoreductase, partial [Sedimentisphaerales bacterium]|nr:NAD(P)-dependent oxidoreductase [Sedimentisphaerales bacterium]
MARRKRKVVVIGAGSVGASYIYALLQTGMAEEVALIDLDRDRVEGEVMDLSHGLQFIPPVHIKAGQYADCTDASLIVITAGAKQSPGQSRADLIRKNAKIVAAICDQISEYESEAVIVMVTNPVDALTQVALERLGWPRHRVIGSGT